MVAADPGLLGRWQEKKMVYRLEHTGCRELAGPVTQSSAGKLSLVHVHMASIGRWSWSKPVGTLAGRSTARVFMRTTQWSGVWVRLRRNPGRRSTACVPVRAA